MTIEQRVDTALKAAMQAKDNARIEALRDIKAQILLARTDGEVMELGDERAIMQLKKMIKMREDSANQADAQHRTDLAALERFRIAVIEEFFPPKVSEAEIKTLAKEVIARTGATSPKDREKVMRELVQRLSERYYDYRMVSSVVNQLLS
jgi:uncharacterized protein